MKKYTLAILASLVFAFMSVSAFAGSNVGTSKATVNSAQSPLTVLTITNFGSLGTTYNVCTTDNSGQGVQQCALLYPGTIVDNT